MGCAVFVLSSQCQVHSLIQLFAIISCLFKAQGITCRNKLINSGFECPAGFGGWKENWGLCQSPAGAGGSQGGRKIVG